MNINELNPSETPRVFINFSFLFSFDQVAKVKEIKNVPKTIKIIGNKNIKDSYGGIDILMSIIAKKNTITLKYIFITFFILRVLLPANMPTALRSAEA